MVEGRLKLVSKWASMVSKAVRVIKKAYPEASVYLIGGAAESRLTVLSDVDLVVVFEGQPPDRAAVLARLWELLEAEGVPPYYPLEIHILGSRELEKLRGAKKRLA